MKSKYNYKAVVNGDSIEIYHYTNKDDLYFEGDSEDVSDRKSKGKERVKSEMIREEIDPEDGRTYEVRVDNYDSLEKKKALGFLDEEQYRVRKLKSADNSANRRKTTVRRLIETNLKAWGYPVFLTITYAENFQDREQAKIDFDYFLKKICYHYGDKAGQNKKRKWLKYVAVIEYQERGAIHFHTVIFNLPYIHATELADLWGHGSIHIQKVRKDTIEEYRKVIGYMCKYMTKTFYDDEETEKTGKLVASPNQNGYLRSKGLHKPQELYFSKDETDKLESLLKEFDIGFESQFINDYTGNVEYKHYYRREEE
jgi:hypothetical protein